MNIESSNLKKTTEIQAQNTNSTNKNKTEDSSVKFADELKEVAKNEAQKETKQEEVKDDNLDMPTDKIAEKEEEEDKSLEINSKQEILNDKNSSKKVPNQEILSEKNPLEILPEKQLIKDASSDKNIIKNPILNNNKLSENTLSGQNNLDNKESSKGVFLEKDKNNNILDFNSAIEDMNSIFKELNQSDDKAVNAIKKEDDLTDKNDMINNDFNIQDNKEILPQMTPNMNFTGDGQPFSSFMNSENEEKKSNNILGSSAQDLAEEAAILSTMAENIAIANKNNALNEKTIQKPSTDKVEKLPIETRVMEKTPVQNIFEKPTKIVMDEEGIKEVDVKTGIKTETIVKYDTVIMNQADVEVFTNLVEKGEVNLNELTPKTAEKAVNVSKTLADMLAKSMENNQPLRINFDNDISVIIRISRDGKITADFLPSSQVAEAYLKENLPLLKQKFEDNNIEYDSLNQRERKEQQKENNKKKDRNNE